MITSLILALLVIIALAVYFYIRRNKSPFGDVTKYVKPSKTFSLSVTDRQGDLHKINQNPNDTSLLSALQNDPDIKARSSCKNAHCGACIAELNEGSVSYFQEGSFPIEGNEILPCSCTIDSDSKITLLARVPRRKKPK